MLLSYGSLIATQLSIAKSILLYLAVTNWHFY